ncbi:hypothetical protein ACWN8P_14275 [Vagococcus salmoninarum]|uniref:Uncharacterized protein n=1 Tax=Vagococcus salmoninarum TaxID=2739 RepID=A0A429ZBW9_9ENTE|nr:hypothetical protein [Vagococcus salmoninarum]RST91192.1 hypothetical protein CBF35_14660 [Vagococcus salmoninarum]
MFKLLKNLKSSNYYYYEDIEELELEEESAKQTKLDTTVQSVDEMGNRVEALKKQVELLKKSNSSETEKLKQQVNTLLKRNEELELNEQTKTQTSEYYQNLESLNSNLEQQLSQETSNVINLKSRLTEVENQPKLPIEETQEYQSLANELKTTKEQLVKYIKQHSDQAEKTVIGNQQATTAFKNDLAKFKAELLATKEESQKFFNDALSGLYKQESAEKLENKKQP